MFSMLNMKGHKSLNTKYLIGSLLNQHSRIANRLSIETM